MARGDLNNASQRTGLGADRGQATSDRDIETAVLRVLKGKLGLDQRAVQDLQALIGLRGEDERPKQAVRRADLSVIGRMQQLQSVEAVGSVTVENFNALREDVRRIYEAFASIGAAVK